MKIFLASASPSDIQWAEEHALVDGVVTSPARLADERPLGDARELLAEICRGTALPVHASVHAVHAHEIHRDGRELARLADNVVVQVPLVDEAIVAVRRLTLEGVRVAATLVFSAAQALLAAKAGASVVTVPVDQLEALGQDALRVVSEIRQLFDRGGVECDLLCAVPRASAAFTRCALAGADAVAVDMPTLRTLLVHPLTDRGVDAFLKEIAARGRPRITPV